jgi:ABC-type Mn2+/Zn2+ transport system ATPase subunit
MRFMAEVKPDTPIISVRDLSVRYEDHTALSDVNFEVYTGDKIAIIGPNGAGKSTLMKALMGLLVPVRNSQIDIVGGHRRLGYVPQHDDVRWDFPVTVHDVVLMGLVRQIGWLRLPSRRHHEQVREALARVGLQNLGHRQVSALSGGQKRRVFMARALAQESDVLILDEPFAGVDVGAQDDLMQVMDALNDDGITLMLSTHDLALASERFNKVMALNRRMVDFGLRDVVYQPHVLEALYGGAFMRLSSATGEGEGEWVVIDEHGCEGCG